MATKVITNFLPKTSEYIDSDMVDCERAGHHNFCVERSICNSDIPIANMDSEELRRFDSEQLEYLKSIDQG